MSLHIIVINQLLFFFLVSHIIKDFKIKYKSTDAGCYFLDCNQPQIWSTFMIKNHHLRFLFSNVILSEIKRY